MLTFHSLQKLNRTTKYHFVNIIREQGTFTLSVYRKSTFSSVYTHFASFLPNTYKIAMTYTLVNLFEYAVTGQCSIHN